LTRNVARQNFFAIGPRLFTKVLSSRDAAQSVTSISGHHFSSLTNYEEETYEVKLRFPMDNSTVESGGFFPPSLPSPAPSSISTTSTTSNLPHPRAHPLRAGSAKEDAARRYVESRLMHVSRRYTKKFQLPDEAEQVHGYESMGEVARDLGEVVDVLWLSGTRM
jgi:hypothetical protein